MQKIIFELNKKDLAQLLGKRVREMRRFHSESPKKIAQLLGVSQMTYQVKERGVRGSFSLWEVLRVSAHWDVKPEAFFQTFLSTTAKFRPTLEQIVLWMNEYCELWGTKRQIPLDILRAASFEENHAAFRECMASTSSRPPISIPRRRGRPRKVRMDATLASPEGEIAPPPPEALVPPSVSGHE